MLLELIVEDGLSPSRKTQSEFSSACPACGGTDRFLIWPDSNRYWCRQCEKSGDGIQYLRDFHQMSYREATDLVSKSSLTYQLKPVKPNRRSIERVTTHMPAQPQKWTYTAKKIIADAHTKLMHHDVSLDWLLSARGISQDTAKQFRLGWIGDDLFLEKEQFGLDLDGGKVFIPSGLVIPWRDIRIRVRRDRIRGYARYHVVRGSRSDLFTIGTAYENTAIIVESELDAILLWQEIKREVFIVALGSAQAKPENLLLGELNYSPIVLVALDTDEAGAKSSRWWLDNLSNSFRTLTPRVFGKDISESFINGMDLNEWLSASLQVCSDRISKFD